jgi:hypothetical protein
MNALDYKYDSNASILSIHDSPNYASELLNIDHHSHHHHRHHHHHQQQQQQHHHHHIKMLLVLNMTQLKQTIIY